MRIAMLTTQWPGVRLGGIGVYTVQCARGLVALGHQVHVFTLPLPADARESAPAGVTLHEVDVIKEPLPAHATEMRIGGELMHRLAVAKQFAATVLQVHAVTPFDILEGPEYEAPGGRLVGGAIPLVTHLHSGSAVGRHVDGEQDLRESLELDVIMRADGVCAPSRAVIEMTRGWYGYAGLATGAEVIGLPFDPPEAPFELPAEDAPVLFVGRLEDVKGADLLAVAARQFLRDHPEATLRIVGPDTRTAPVGTYAKGSRSMLAWMQRQLEGDVAARVTFLGERSHAEIEREMRDCAFVVVPSRRESYSYVCCEAMAAGRAVVVSAGIGATEVVGDAGIVFKRKDVKDFARAMGDLWRDSALRADLSRRAWERVRTVLSPARTLPQRVEFYKQVISRPRAGEPVVAKDFDHRWQIHQWRVWVGGALTDHRALEEVKFEMRAGRLEPALLTPGDRVVRQLKTLGQSAVSFHLFGAGRHTARLLMERARWEENGHRVCGLIDDHPRYVEEPRCYGLSVISVKQAEKSLGEGDVVVLSTDAFEDAFWEATATLRAQGVRVFRLYS